MDFDCLQVLKLDDSNSTLPYFVHYVGWNNRYDEWISRDVIVGLTDATPERPGRTPKSLTKVENLVDFIIDDFCLCCILLLVECIFICVDLQR